MTYDVFTLACNICGTTFMVMTELQNHQLDQHERPLPVWHTPPHVEMYEGRASDGT